MNKETIWQDVSYIISREHRRKVLESLNSPKTASKLSKEVNINIAHISRALSELTEKKLIQCLTPESNKGKLYVITEHGKKVLEQSSKI